MLVSIDGGVSIITGDSMFNISMDKFMVETFSFQAGYRTPLVFQMIEGAAVNIGDDRGIPYHNGLDIWANEILFGTNADDLNFRDGTEHDPVWISMSLRTGWISPRLPPSPRLLTWPKPK